MDKIYFSIAEVADMFKMSQSNLRFWEKEFKQLNPKRNDKGTRFYTHEDIAVIKKIFFLIEEQNLTLAGVKRKLSQRKDDVDKQHEIYERLKTIRKELKAIAAAL
jgi:DNA-binding transcriptional MerR regulator